jgi:hypothetical protein
MKETRIMHKPNREDVERIAKVLQKVQWGNLHLWDELHESVKRQWRSLAVAAIEEVTLLLASKIWNEIEEEGGDEI